MAFWIEIQVDNGRSSFVVERYRNQLITVIALYFALRVARTGLEMGGANGGTKFAMKGTSSPACSPRRTAVSSRTRSRPQNAEPPMQKLGCGTPMG